MELRNLVPYDLCFFLGTFPCRKGTSLRQLEGGKIE